VVPPRSDQVVSKVDKDIPIVRQRLQLLRQLVLRRLPSGRRPTVLLLLLLPLLPLLLLVATSAAPIAARRNKGLPF
jgi:hypothetical protein